MPPRLLGFPLGRGDKSSVSSGDISWITSRANDASCNANYQTGKEKNIL